MEKAMKWQLMPKKETDWFRGIAVIMVVVSHYAEWWSWFAPMEGNAEIFRLALTKLGVYGVDIFFLFSGYAMVKSLGRERMHGQFVWKRIKNVYIPYFIVVGIIELLSGGFTSIQDFLAFASGYDYWYMYVLFMLYIRFIAVYTIIGGRLPRIAVFSVIVYIMSHVLYQKGMQDFWYVSNITFVLGVIAGEYEETVKKVLDKVWIFLAAALAVGMGVVVKWGLDGGVDLGGNPTGYQLWFQIGATVVWALLVLIMAAKCGVRGKVLVFLGQNSLYIYLTHTYIFMKCVNSLELDYIWRFLISAVATVFVSFLCNRLITWAGKMVFGRMEVR
ncbi:MAG: acyltransferase [Lachnospiraceae bacterium]|jgi:peptidoglycan/LPS O-acetylase OafA/YrhL|nr:acyltransferase [Lachnospiraceae bacterium]